MEIEGCWPMPRQDLIPDGSMRDHEFQIPYYNHPDTGKKTPLFGELVSIPMDERAVVLDYLDKNWVSETGPLCGFHIHLSFQKIGHYCACMSQDFYDKFVEGITEWGLANCMEDNLENGLFWQRLEDKNKYCRDKFIPDEQAAISVKTVADPRRYCLFNYCWNMHKTIECRLFPTFKSKELAKSATAFLMDFAESYLNNLNLLETTSVEDQVSHDEDTAPIQRIELPAFNLYGKFAPVSFRLKNIRSVIDLLAPRDKGMPKDSQKLRERLRNKRKRLLIKQQQEIMVKITEQMKKDKEAFQPITDNPAIEKNKMGDVLSCSMNEKELKVPQMLKRSNKKYPPMAMPPMIDDDNLLAH